MRQLPMHIDGVLKRVKWCRVPVDVRGIVEAVEAENARIKEVKQLGYKKFRLSGPDRGLFYDFDYDNRPIIEDYEQCR